MASHQVLQKLSPGITENVQKSKFGMFLHCLLCFWGQAPFVSVSDVWPYLLPVLFQECFMFLKYVYIYINLKKSCKIKPHKRQQRKRREKRMHITFQQQTKTCAYFQWKHLCQAANLQVNTGMNEDMDEISLTHLAPGEVCCRFKWVAGSFFLNSGGEIWGGQVTRC